jgi:hypothetical protein
MVRRTLLSRSGSMLLSRTAVSMAVEVVAGEIVAHSNPLVTWAASWDGSSDAAAANVMPGSCRCHSRVGSYT